MITVRADMPTMDGNVTMTCEPIFDEGMEFASWSVKVKPTWKFVDAAGHRFDAENFRARTRFEYEDYFDEDGEEYSESWAVCKQCGETITPDWVNDTMCYSVRTPDRYLGMKTTLTYTEHTQSSTCDRTWVFNNDELTQKILDLGGVNDEILAELGDDCKVSFYSW